MIVQSATAAEKLTPRKNCCIIRPEAELVINNLISTQGCLNHRVVSIQNVGFKSSIQIIQNIDFKLREQNS